MKSVFTKYIVAVMILISSLQADYIDDYDFVGDVSYAEYMQMVKEIGKKEEFKYIPIVEMELKFLVDIPKGSPYIISETRYSASNTPVTYYFFSRKTFKIVAVLEHIKSVSTQDGHKVASQGFFKGKNGEWLIEKYTTKGTPMAECNSCQTYNVETYQLVGNKLIFKSVRPFGLKYN